MHSLSRILLSLALPVLALVPLFLVSLAGAPASAQERCRIAPVPVSPERREYEPRAGTPRCLPPVPRPPVPRPPPYEPPPHTGSYDVDLVDERGVPLRTFHHDGERFVLGSIGERFGVRLVNHTSHRVEAVVSVDGRDVISGRVASYVTERGYVLEPFATITVSGFRQSWEHVATFRFTSPSDSYSSRQGTPQNVGVIGVAFFPEAAPPTWQRPSPPVASAPRDSSGTLRDSDGQLRDSELRREPAHPSSTHSSSAPQAPRKRASSPSSSSRGWEPPAAADRLGTQYGETRSSGAHHTHFVRSNTTHPAILTTLRYDDAAGLEARGIAVHWPQPRPVPHSPEAFPDRRARSYTRFAPPPLLY